MDPAHGALTHMTAGAIVPIAMLLVVLAALLLATMRYRRHGRALRDELDNTRGLIENLSDGIYRSSLDGKQLSANRALVRLNGYDSEAELLASVKDIAVEWYVEPTRRDEFRAILNRDGRVEDFVSEIYRHKTRERIWITESARIVHDKVGRPLYYEGSVREFTETVKRLQFEEMFQKLTDQLPGGLFQLVRHPDGQVTIPYASLGAKRIVGLPDEFALNEPSPIRARIHRDDLPGYDVAMRTSRQMLGALDYEFRLLLDCGETRWLRVLATPEANGDAITWHGYIADISTRKAQEMEIEKLAFFDPLTGLPNRRLLLDRLNAALACCQEKTRSGALLFIDLDNFKSLNDTKGHDVGDEYLVQVAERLRGCVAAGDTVARIGGDEFVVVAADAGMDKAHATARAITLSNRILSALNAPVQLSQIRHQGSASVGVVLFDAEDTRADELLKRADVAMYEAKAAGRNALSIFDPASMVRETERYELIIALREAIDRDHLKLHFQPQMDRDGRLCAVEALVRWYHPDHGIIKPDRFIPLAEASGLINDLGRIVLAKGVLTLAEWSSDPALAELRLAVNVSVQSFAAPDFVTYLQGLIARHRIDASRLTLEFTEHVMAENHAMTAQRMQELKSMGIRFSLDDFGTGYSSIAYLKELPFDEVKIAGSFVGDITSSEDDRALVRTILAMATTLGLTSVAEKVETAEQEAFLRRHGCDVFQGYHYSAPLAGPDLTAFASRARAAERRAGSARLSA